MNTTMECQCGCGHRFTFTGVDGAAALVVHAAEGRMLGMHLLAGAEARRVAYGILGAPRTRTVAVSIPDDQGKLVLGGHISVNQGAGMVVHDSIPYGTVLRGWQINARNRFG
ncbi:MAG: hypothetical protein E6Q97_12375 [Desulfurellales bacterium]|nr:MAG: hypothetical protein E6Q97_12375 [Desulfurellales bacterium]